MSFWSFPKRKLSLICFDLDNTLYDYSTAEAQTEAYIAEELHRLIKKVPVIDILRTFNDVKHSHMHHDIEPEKFSRALWIKETASKFDKVLSQDKAAELEKKYWSYLKPLIKMFPNTLKVLDELKNSGRFKIATITDSDGRKEIKIDRIKAVGLDKYFDYMLTTDDTKKNKPSIENWYNLLRISGMQAQNCMMIGDHPDVDLINAKKLGFVTVWSKEHIPTMQHFKFVDHEITDIAQLLGIVKKYS
jgi:2-haloacid dehalogenase